MMVILAMRAEGVVLKGRVRAWVGRERRRRWKAIVWFFGRNGGWEVEVEVGSGLVGGVGLVGWLVGRWEGGGWVWWW